MQTKSRELIVGFFLISGLVLMAAMILFFGKFKDELSETYTVKVIFPRANGIQKGSSVNCSGVTIGRVIANPAAFDEGRSAVVEVRIKRDAGIREDARFKIASSGLLGDRIIDVEPKSNTAQPLQDGQTVRGERVPSMEETMAKAEPLVVSLATIALEARKALAKLNKNKVPPATSDGPRLATDASLAGETPAESPEATNLPQGTATFTSHPPVVDGVWSEGEWNEAVPMRFPVGGDARLSTETRFLWTKEGVFVTFRSVDNTLVYGSFKPGEPLYQEDVYELFVDEAGDHRQFLELQVDPAGQVYIRNNLLTAAPRVTAEGRLTQEFVERELWRYVLPVPEGFRVASRHVKETGVWTAELFLPAAFINRRRSGAPMEPTTWRINLVRHNWDQPFSVPNRKADMLYWAPVLPGHPHISPTLMGYLKLKK